MFDASYTSVRSSASYASSPEIAQAPAAIDPAAFDRWPVVMQVRYLVEKNQGLGGTAGAILGGSGNQALARLLPNGVDVEITPVPRGFGTDPRDLDPGDFAAWDTEFQVAYLRARGSGTPTSVDLGPAGRTVRAVLGADLTSVELTASAGYAAQVDVRALLATSPAQMDPAAFLSLPPDRQLAYASLYGATVVPLAQRGMLTDQDGNRLRFADPSTDPTQLSFATVEANGKAFRIGFPAAAFPGFVQDSAARPTDAGAGIRAADFLSWPKAIQQTFVERGFEGLGGVGAPEPTYPKTVLIGTAPDPRVVASIARAGADIATAPLPADYATPPGRLTAARFLRWPAPVQTLYLDEHGTRTLGGTTLAIGPTGSQITVSRTSFSFGGQPILLQLSAVANLATDPASLDPDVFSYWSASDRRSYAQRWASGATGAVLGGGEQSALLTRDATGAPILRSYPPGYDTAPDDLSASTYLGFEEAFRVRYAREHLPGGTGTLTIGNTIAVNLDAAGTLLVADTAATTFWDPVRSSASMAGDRGTGTAPADLAPATFVAWPVSTQVAYVQANSAGSRPPTVMIGPPGQQVLAQVAGPGGRAVDVVAPDDAFRSPPALQTLAAFRELDPRLQVEYVRRYGAGTPPSVDIGPAGQTLKLAIPLGGTDVVVTASAGYRARPDVAALLAAADPLTVRAQDFLALPPDLQIEYGLARARTGAGVLVYDPTVSTAADPNQLRTVRSAVPTLALMGSDTGSSARIQIVANGRTLTVAIPLERYPGLSDNLFNTDIGGIPGQAVARNTLDGAQFLTLPPQVRQAVLAQAYDSGGPPRTFVIGGQAADNGNAVVASVLRTNAPLITAPLPAGFATAPDQLAPRTFLNWPSIVQDAYFRAEATGFPATLVIGSRVNAITVTRAANALPAVAATPDHTAPPSAIDPDVFALWPPSEQGNYFFGHATNAPPSLFLNLGPAGSQVRLSYSQGTLVGEPFPAAYATPPDRLAAGTFLSWPPLFREAYVRDNMRGSQTALTIGPQGAQITASFTGGSTLVIAGDTLQATPGQDAALIPYYYLPGSGVGADSPQIDAIADKLYPALTGDPSVAGSTIPDSEKPAAFDTAPALLKPAEFGSWHSAVQLEYVRRHGSGSPPSVTVGASLPNATPITALIASPVAPATTGTRLYVVESLTKQDIAKMSTADQTALTALPAFGKLGTALGLIANKGEATVLLTEADAVIASPGGKLDPSGKTMVDGAMPADDRKAFTDQIDIIRTQLAGQAVLSLKDVKDKINAIMTRFARANAFSYNVNGAGQAKPVDVAWSQPTITVGPAVYGPPVFNGLLPTADPNDLKLFDFVAGTPLTADGTALGGFAVGVRTSDFLARDLPKLPKFDATTLTPQGGDTVAQTYQYIAGYLTVDNKIKANYVNVTFTYEASRVMGSGASLDGNVTIKAGYDTFMAQERQIRDLAVKQQALATTGANGTRQLDVPTLVFLFQLYSNLTGEAVVRAETEEVNQTNALLQAYALVQRIINRTVGTIKNPNASEPQIANLEAKTEEERSALRMFNDWNGKDYPKGPPNTYAEESPIERIKGIARPKSNLNLDPVTGKTASQWQATASQFSDTVTLINQESQLKMNNINSITKQKDRNFDLANNALAKANEIIQKIAGAA